MRNTLLTRTQLGILENALLHYDNIVTTAQLASLLAAQTDVRKRQIAKQMADPGWLVRVKRGLYQIADLCSLGMLTLSRFTVAQLLVEEAYAHQ